MNQSRVRTNRLLPSSLAVNAVKMMENSPIVNMNLERTILAGDVGGTKTLLGLFAPGRIRPEPIVVREFVTTEFHDLTAMISAFSAERTITGTVVHRASFGVAGPVLGDDAELTNVSFRISAREIASVFDIPRVGLLNDLQAMAYAVPLLQDDEVVVLQEGEPVEGGNLALIAAGTGLGEALLHSVNGRMIPSPTESGHADWAARTERDIAILRGLTERFGRAEVEHVLSGQGLVHLHALTHDSPCAFVEREDDPQAPAAISQAALAGQCRGCMEALSIFVDAYGAEAGNLALRSLATGGLFVGGGIAPKILPALTDGRFVRAFQSKGTFKDLLVRVPIRVILKTDAGLLGAAAAAAEDPT
jgi:glucokinase